MKKLVIHVINKLDQPVTVTPIGITDIYTQRTDQKAYAPFSSMQVNPNSSDSMVLTEDNWMPYISVQIKCASTTAPSTGDISVIAVLGIDRGFGRPNVAKKITLVKNFELRDTNVHDPSTDPDKFDWIEF